MAQSPAAEKLPRDLQRSLTQAEGRGYTAMTGVISAREHLEASSSCTAQSHAELLRVRACLLEILEGADPLNMARVGISHLDRGAIKTRQSHQHIAEATAAITAVTTAIRITVGDIERQLVGRHTET